MRLLTLSIACCVGVSLLGSLVAARTSEGRRFQWEWRLASANRLYDEGDWLAALKLYRYVRTERADLLNDDEICFRIARCSELALPTLEKLIPSELDSNWRYGRKMMTWLRDTYGYYVQGSEGDAWWVYDKRALRELLRRHPRSHYADDAEYVLVKYDLVYVKRNPYHIQEAWPEAVRRYERLLERYPDTNLRPIILEELAFLKDPNGDRSGWVGHYWNSPSFRYP